MISSTIPIAEARPTFFSENAVLIVLITNVVVPIMPFVVVRFADDGYGHAVLDGIAYTEGLY